MMGYQRIPGPMLAMLLDAFTRANVTPIMTTSAPIGREATVLTPGGRIVYAYEVPPWEDLWTMPYVVGFPVRAWVVDARDGTAITNERGRRHFFNVGGTRASQALADQARPSWRIVPILDWPPHPPKMVADPRQPWER